MRPHDLSFVFPIILVLVSALAAQEATFQAVPAGPGSSRRVIVGPDGKPRMLPPGVKLPGGMSGARPGSPMPPKKEDDQSKKKETDKEADNEDKKDDAKVLTRPEKPPMPADPNELKVAPNADGLIRFNFRYQTWPDVLDWLAVISKMSLDWQELPNDFLNLTTQREYTVVETHDLINRHLLARGFTLVENGRGLSVVAIAKLNPAMVPRIRVEDLDQLADEQPYKFVKVSFSLDWLLADQAAKEFEPMLSSNGKLIPLTNTNRIEGMDAAINLREIHALLKQEQSDQGESPLVSEFVLDHARAADVLEELQTLLGLQAKKATASPMTSSQMRAMQQQQQQMAQQMAQQRGGQKSSTPAKKETPVHLVVNKRKNSILAHAPPDKMAIIGQAIQALDVRSERSDSLLGRPNQMEIYRLNNLDPAALAKTLEDLGDLQPSTHLEVDEDNNALIVFGSIIDQAMIRQLVQRLDGNSRHFEVVRLRRLAADYVAGTVQFMMVGEEEKKQQPRYYDFYSSRYGSQNKKGQGNDKFRVDADVQHNMLLLWANDQEVEAVMQLLEKLGELPPAGGNPDKVRVLTRIAPEDAAEFLEKLRRAWPSLSPNELKLPDLPPQPPADPATPMPTSPQSPSSDKEVRSVPPAPVLLRDVALFRADDPPATDEIAAGIEQAGSPPPADEATDSETEPNTANSPDAKPSDEKSDAEPAGASSDAEARDGRQTLEGLPRRPVSEPPAEAAGREAPEPTQDELLRRFFSRREAEESSDTPPPPINLSFAPDGSLVIASEDTAALDVLEELVQQTAPPLPDYKIFKLQYADAYWVMDNIEMFFEEDDDEDDNPFGRIFFGFPQESSSDSPNRLSQRRKLKFIYDLDTNSILVQGANSQQLKTIEDLISVYDQPEPTNSQSARVSTAFPIRYSKASVVAEAIKDVYRDLLSSNDKALQNGNPERKNRESRDATYIFGGAGGGEPERTQVKFKGKLSIGIDEVTNTLLVSAEGENLMRNVGDMVKTLDEAAKPLSNYSIVHLKGNTNAARIREVLLTLLADGPSQPSSPAAKSPEGQQNGPNRPRGPSRGNSPGAAETRLAPN